MVPRETGNNALCKIWRDKQGSLMIFSKVAYCIYSTCGFVFPPITGHRSNEKKTIRLLSFLK